MKPGPTLTAVLTLVVGAGACNNPFGHGAPMADARNPTYFAVTGDVPYGAGATALFPTLIESINADPHVRRAVHVGDTKSGSTECTDDWFDYIYGQFQSFLDPLVYTPGDNEWTDCHRPNNGGWNPNERLEKIRETYFSKPGRPLGGRGLDVHAQRGYPENQMWMESRVVFAAIHTVGSNNNLLEWTDETPEMAAERQAEWAGRDAANRAWLDAAFDLAQVKGAVGVVLFSHADMWHPSDIGDPSVSFSGHQAYVELLAARASAFGKPVLLFAGDSHDYRVDQPLIGDVVYGAQDAPNVTQITVERGIEGSVLNWLKLRVDPRSDEVFTWEEVEFEVN